MRDFLKGKNLILLLILLAFFVYVWRLDETLLFVEDTARDTLAMLKIWQQKELTLIGPPISYGQQGIRAMFFGSLAYYVGLIGLVLARFNPLGAIYPNTFFFLLSIPLFVLFIRQMTKEKGIIYGATVLYALSPITVYHARFFWNPNLIIPLSVLFWYLILRKSGKKGFWRFLASGFVGGLITNLHYISILPVFIYTLSLFFRKKIKHGLAVLTGFVIASVPLTLFELKNNFYLTQAAIFNIQHPSSQKILSLNLFTNFFDGVWATTGLKHAEFPFTTIPVSQALFFVLNLLALFLVIKVFRQGHFKGKIFPLIILATSNIAALIFSVETFHLRYLFPVYPLLIWFIGALFFGRHLRYLGLAVFFPLVFATYMIIQDTPSISKNYLPLSKINAISSYVVKDHPRPPYNITENIAGGAQAIPFRYVLVRDAKVELNDEKSYENLTTLYVVSPRLDKIYKENRWEFTATPDMNLTQTTDFGEVQLFKFEKKK